MTTEPGTCAHTAAHAQVPVALAQARAKDGQLKSGAFLSGQGSRLSCRDGTDMDELLKELPDLRNVSLFSSKDAAVTDEHLRVLAESCQLDILVVTNGKITDKGMKFIAKQKRLRESEKG